MKQTMPLGKTAETQVHALSYINLYLNDHVIHFLGVKKQNTLTLVLYLVMAAQRVFRVAAATARLAQAAQ